MCRKRIRGALWQRLAAGCSRLLLNVKQFGFKLRLKVLTDGARTLKAFADNANGIRGTESNNLSEDSNVRADR